MTTDREQDPRTFAFYLPQFHPVPENDAWWGPGFTEWRNVARARPLFPGHHQPHLPRELGFYDLRLPETRAAQAELATRYGVSGFVYYHYWFNGRRMLQRPFEEVLASGEPSLPFCLAWANENWTRAWDGRSGEALLTQHYSSEDDLTHVRALLPAFADPRYVRHAGRPVFLVYRSGLLPDPKRTTDLWRGEVVRAGLPEPYLLQVESFPEEVGDPADSGFDAAVEFAPRWPELPLPPRAVRLGARLTRFRGPFRHGLYPYAEVARLAANRPDPPYARWPGVTPMWDNSARRRSGGVVLTGSTPELYQRWLESALTLSRAVARAEGIGGPLVFVNAWNEWAEGNHLEPDLRHGLAYLEAHARAVSARR